MPGLQYKVRGNSPQGKPRVYFCCHKEDFPVYFEKISEAILNNHSCAIWYREDFSAYDGDLENDLKQMQLLVIPVTLKLLTTENQALRREFVIAVNHHIPILPLMQEPGLEALFNAKCGNLHFLNPCQSDATAISFEEKLKKYLEAVLIGDELADMIRAEFIAYIFLSYRKKDRKHAQELMRLIHKNDFCRDVAIWYDEFLTPGEDFSHAIKAALQKSDLFVLAVTPNLVNESNYVMTTEYPMAKEEAKSIFPVELVRTRKNKLVKNFDGIPSPINVHNSKRFSNALKAHIDNISAGDIKNSPKHSFCMGLAYLNGIDVEVNREFAVNLITFAAENQLPEAMKKLSVMYRDGTAVSIDYAKSVYWAEKHYNYCLQTLGEIHPDTLESLCDLASAWGAAGNYQKQEQDYGQACMYYKIVFGADHPKTLDVYSRHAVALALCYDEKVKNDQFGYRELALRSSEGLYYQYRDTFGEEHPATIQALSNLGFASSKWRRHHRQTFECYEKVYQLRKKLLGEEHPETISALSDLASAYGNYRDYEIQLEMLEKVYAVYRKLYGEEHPATIAAIYHLADCHFKMEHFRKGIELNVKVCELRRKILGEDHTETQKAYENIGFMYKYFDWNPANAEAYEAIFEARSRLQGETHIDTLRALARIIRFYDKPEDEAKREAYLARAYKLKKEVLKRNRRNRIKASIEKAIPCLKRSR